MERLPTVVFAAEAWHGSSKNKHRFIPPILALHRFSKNFLLQKCREFLCFNFTGLLLQAFFLGLVVRDFLYRLHCELPFMRPFWMAAGRDLTHGSAFRLYSKPTAF